MGRKQNPRAKNPGVSMTQYATTQGNMDDATPYDADA